MLVEKTTLKSSSLLASGETLQVTSSRGRGRPRKRPATVVSMTTKQPPPVTRVITFQPSSGSIGSQAVAQRIDGSNIRPPTVPGKTTPTALGKTSVLLDKSSAVMLAKSPAVLLTKPASTASRVVVIDTSSVAGAKSQASQTRTVSSSTVMKSALSHGGSSDRIGLPAGSSISSKPGTSATVVIIRSSASSSSSSNTPAAATVVKNSSGSVVMSVKKVSSVLPLKYSGVRDGPGAAPAPAKLAPAKLTQAKLAPVIKLPPFGRPAPQGSAVAVVPQKTGSTLLHDGLKMSSTNTSYQAAHTKRFVAFIMIRAGQILDCV